MCILANASTTIPCTKQDYHFAFFLLLRLNGIIRKVHDHCTRIVPSFHSYHTLIIYYWAAHKGNDQSRNEKQHSFYVKKRQNGWQTELPEGFACLIPHSMEPIFEERRQVILGHLAKRFGRQFENKNYCIVLLALYLLRIIIQIQYYFDDCISLCGSCSVETMPSHGPHRKSFDLLQNYSLPVCEKSFLKKGICYLQITPSNSNIFTRKVRRALNATSYRNKTKTLLCEF